MSNKLRFAAIVLSFITGCGSAPPPDRPSRSEPDAEAEAEVDARRSPPHADAEQVPGGTDAAVVTVDAAVEVMVDAAFGDAMASEAAEVPVDGGQVGTFPVEAVKSARPEKYVSLTGHLEGPSWRNGELFLAQDGAGLLRVDATRKVHPYLPRLGPAGSYALADGSLLLCDHTDTVVDVLPDGKVAVLGSGGVFCNDLTVDKAGNIYFSDYGEPSGNVYRITPDGHQEKAVTGVSAPNGVEVDPASAYLYIAVSHNGVVRVKLGETLPLGPPERVVMMANGTDGMAFDEWGHLWMALYTPGTLGIYDPPTQKILATIDAGGHPVTNLTFGGPHRDEVFTTVDNQGVFRIPVGAAGFAGHPGAPHYTPKRILPFTATN
jgi:sugar lactone lactonase YvrE